MDVSKLFERGQQAFERGSWELAIMVWQQLLVMQPEHLEARKLIREAANRKWTQEGKGVAAKVIAVVKGLGPIASFLVHMVSKNYDRAMMDCEKVLALDPNNGLVLWGLTQAAVKGGHPDVAVVSLEYMHNHNPKNVRVLRNLGHFYEERGDISQAMGVWERVRSLIHSDREAQTKIRDLAATKSMVDGRYETATQKDATYRDSLKSKAGAEEMEQEHRIIRTDEDVQRAIERVSRDVEQNPEQKRYVIQLGDLYHRAGEFQKARECYERAQKIDAMDFSVPELLGELRIDELTRDEKALLKKLETEPDNSAIKAELAALRKQKFEFSLKEYRRQVQVRPTDAELHSKLGDLYFSAHMFDEAAVEFQKAAADPRSQRRCRKMVGVSLFNTGKHQLAVNQFEQAIKGGSVTSPEVRDIMYYLAATYDKLGDLEKAQLFYQKIFDVDMSYKDVQARLDSVMRRRQSAGTEGSEKGGAPA